MKLRLIINLIFALILMSCAVQSSKKSDKKLQQVGYVTICDTSKIYLYNSELQDTLKGKGVIRLSLQNKNCDVIKITSGQILFLSITKTSNGDKIIEYRHMTTRGLTSDEKKLLVFYENELYDTFKNRGICCLNDNAYLDCDKFDFPFTFFVLPR